LACAICETRKEKRFCPAVHGRICPTCCGTERELTLDCPSDCVYLQQARRNERPRNLNDMEQLAFLQVDLPSDVTYRREPLVIGLSYAIAAAARRDRALNDRDFIGALTTMAKTYETLVNSGLVYQAPSANPVQQVIVAELERMIAEYRETEQKQLGYSTLRDSETLQVIVWLLRLALSHSNGRPRCRAFVDFAFEMFPEKESIISGPEKGGSRLIIP
jgi:hypothetical protein